MSLNCADTARFKLSLAFLNCCATSSAVMPCANARSIETAVKANVNASAPRSVTWRTKLMNSARSGAGGKRTVWSSSQTIGSAVCCLGLPASGSASVRGPINQPPTSVNRKACKRLLSLTSISIAPNQASASRKMHSKITPMVPFQSSKRAGSVLTRPPLVANHHSLRLAVVHAQSGKNSNNCQRSVAQSTHAPTCKPRKMRTT